MLPTAADASKAHGKADTRYCLRLVEGRKQSQGKVPVRGLGSGLAELAVVVGWAVEIVGVDAGEEASDCTMGIAGTAAGAAVAALAVGDPHADAWMNLP